jgi:Trypsin-like peptidase domain/Tetratricopeptide repeat
MDRTGQGWPALLGTLLLVAAPARAGERAAVEHLMGSTVCVVGDVRGGSFESSGFVVEPGDVVLTTAHGIGGATNLRVKLRDGRIFPARVERLGNESADIALLDVIGAKLLPVRFGSVRELKSGDDVLTIGCPLGFEFTVTSGVVSSIRESDLGYPLIQTDVPVNPGSSGGPLFDSRGRVVGIIKSSVAGRERIHFALPADLATALLDQITRERQAYEIFNQAALEPKIEEKLALYQRVLGLDPGRFEAHYNLGLILERTGKTAEAQAQYRETLRLRPSFTPAALNLGALLYGEKRYQDAIAVYRRALASDAQSEAVRNNLAEAYRAAGDQADARREFEAVLDRNPNYAPAHYGLALLYDDPHGDRRRAAEHYRRYLALAPEAADADKVRQWLREAEGAERTK